MSVSRAIYISGAKQPLRSIEDIAKAGLEYKLVEIRLGKTYREEQKCKGKD
jgi:hypothetical protein